MKKLIMLAFIIFGLSNINSVFAQQSSTQFVDITISEMSVINTNGILVFSFNSLTAGENPEPLSTTTTYSISTNGSNKKITGELDVELPTGLSISVDMAAPIGASSTGIQTLSTFPSDLVTGISKMRGEVLNVDWNVDATIDVEPGTYSRLITFTITNN